MNTFIKRIYKNNFINNVLVLLTGMAGIQLLGLLLMPMYTRLFGPHAYGLLGSFNAVLSLIAPLSTLSLPLAIVIAKNDDELSQLSAISLITCLFFSFSLFIVIAIFQNKILIVLNLVDLGYLIYLLPLVIIFSGLDQIIRNLNIRNENFKNIRNATLKQTFVTNLLLIIFAFKLPSFKSLLIINSGNLLLSSRFMLKDNIYKYAKYLIKNFELKESIILLKKYLDFAIYRSPQISINSFSYSMPILFLNKFYGAEVAGLYSLASIVTTIPINLIGNSVSQVFYPKFNSEYNKNGNCKLLIYRTTLILLIIGLIPLLILILIGPWIFSLVFGDMWYKSGIIAQWLSVWFLMTLVTKPLISIVPVINLQGQLLVFEIFNLIFRILSIYIGYVIYDDFLYSIGILCIFSFASYLMLIIYIFLKI